MIGFGQCISGDCENGYGTYNYKALKGEADSQYVGEWKDGKFHGQGTFTVKYGGKYVGEWKNGMKSGKGTMTYLDGSKYVGLWWNDKKFGQGTMTYVSGRVKKGVWLNNEFDEELSKIYNEFDEELSKLVHQRHQDDSIYENELQRELQRIESGKLTDAEMWSIMSNTEKNIFKDSFAYFYKWVSTLTEPIRDEFINRLWEVKPFLPSDTIKKK